MSIDQSKSEQARANRNAGRRFRDGGGVGAQLADVEVIVGGKSNELTAREAAPPLPMASSQMFREKDPPSRASATTGRSSGRRQSPLPLPVGAQHACQRGRPTLFRQSFPQRQSHAGQPAQGERRRFGNRPQLHPIEGPAVPNIHEQSVVAGVDNKVDRCDLAVRLRDAVAADRDAGDVADLHGGTLPSS